jgi:hypothetical protein
MRIEESIEIGRPRTQVWALVVEPLNDPRWCPKVKSVELVGEGQWRVTHKPVPLRPPMQLMVAHTGLEAPSLLRMREEDEVSVFEVEYRLAELGLGDDGTRFTQISEFAWKKLQRILHGTFRRGVQRDVRAQLRELKRVLEQPQGH